MNVNHQLSPIEIRILALVAHGYNNDTIAEQLDRSVNTVKTHLRRMTARVGARNRAHLVTYGYETGLLIPRTVDRG